MTDLAERVSPARNLAHGRRVVAGEAKKNRIARTKSTRKSAVCITTTYDRNYALAGETLFKSIRHYTDCSGVDFKVITADQEVVARLGAENCHVITPEAQARYANVKYFKDLPREKYYQSWYRYEIFGMTDYDRVICIDSDCLCLGDISYLFSEELNKYDLISVQDYIVSDLWMTHLLPELEAQGLNFEGLYRRKKEGKIDIQPALLVANKSIVTKEWHDRLLQYANDSPFAYSIDQGILNNFAYDNNWRIKLLPLEYDYQDLYEVLIPTLRVPDKPIIVHCQQSKPFKYDRATLDPRLQKRFDQWWKEHDRVEEKPAEGKTIVAIIVWNRFNNLERWLRCWDLCDHAGAELVIVHNLETNNVRYEQLCQKHNVRYVPRQNKGFDIGAFQDVCLDRVPGFPTDWENLIWITDDCIPMQKDFVAQYLAIKKHGELPCYEISDQVKRHIRTTGFMVTREIARRLVFPADPIQTREHCYIFEHKGVNMYEQVVQMGYRPHMVTSTVRDAPLWDSGFWTSLHSTLMPRHETLFIPPPVVQSPHRSEGIMDEMAIKHRADKSSWIHNFTAKYDRLLSQSRERFTSIMEIGVGHGQSMKMWADYFPNAAIHGVDLPTAAAKQGIDLNATIKECSRYSNRIQIHVADQNDLAQLKDLEQFGPFDLIVDDGNHLWREQILSFEALFTYVKSGGLYVVEDSVTSYWPEYNNNPISCVEYFKKLIDDVNFHGARGRIPANPPMDFPWDKGWHRREDCQATLPAFDSIQFMNALIVITKR